MSKNDYLENMKKLLGGDYDEFYACLSQEPFRGIYINTLKCDIDRFKSIFPYSLRLTPFSEKGFYIDNSVPKLGTHPLHHAGAFYIQEPSAMSAATALEIKSGDKVLDLCAAPGGKTADIAGFLAGSGLIWSNEYVKSRAFTLLSNCERMGIRNGVVSNCEAGVLARELPCFFDKILVDAPCSGEGMLRRGKALYSDWNFNNIHLCAERQKTILSNAAEMLKCGGRLVYSTCTFNTEENEGVIASFLSEHKEFKLAEIEGNFGRSGFGMPEARRIFPMDGGEGHFLAALEKIGGEAVKYNSFTPITPTNEFAVFAKNNFSSTLFGKAHADGEKIYLIPDDFPQTKNLNILRAGVLAGEFRNARFLPHHSLYTAMRASDCAAVLDFPSDSAEIRSFLHGEELDADIHKGYCGVAADGIVTGFGKVSGGRLKNHYPKGLRNLK